MIYLIHGFTGAGKTTFSKEFERETGAVRYSPDEWMRKRYGLNPPAHLFARYYSETEKDILADAREKVRQGQDIIFDFGFWTRAQRDLYRGKAQEWGASCKMLWIKAEDETMEARVLARSALLPGDQLVIDKNAIEEFRARFETLQGDEDYTVIENPDREKPETGFLQCFPDSGHNRP